MQKSLNNFMSATLVTRLIITAGVCTALLSIYPGWKFFSPESVTAESADTTIYTYTDNTGKLFFVDSLDRVPEEFRAAAKERSDLPPLNRVEDRNIEVKTAKPAAAASVTVLVAEWCGYCRMLESFLKGRGIAYTRYDIETSTKGRTLYRKHGTGGVPITLVNDRLIRGFNPAAILKALATSSSKGNPT
jgi:glutaredoxin